MTTLVPFVPKTVPSCALSLLVNLENLNSTGLDKLTRLVKERFQEKTREKPVGRKKLVALVTSRNEENKPLGLIEAIQTTFFQSLQIREIPSYHKKTLEGVVVGFLQYADLKFSKEEEEVLKEWLARLFESYMTKESIESSYENRQEKGAASHKKRGEVGNQMATYIKAGLFNKADFDAMFSLIEKGNQQLKETPHREETSKIAGGYLEVLALGDEALEKDLFEKLISFSKREWK